MRRQASQVLLALRACYDASGGGYWRSLQEDGSAVPVRTVIDFHTVGSLLGAPSASAMFAGGGSVTEQMRGEMASFVERELRTAGRAHRDDDSSDEEDAREGAKRSQQLSFFFLMLIVLPILLMGGGWALGALGLVGSNEAAQHHAALTAFYRQVDRSKLKIVSN